MVDSRLKKKKNYPPETWTGYWLIVDSEDEERKFGVMKEIFSGDAVQFDRGWTERFGDIQVNTIPIEESEYGSYIALGLFPELEVEKHGYVTLFGQPMEQGKNPTQLKVIMPPEKLREYDLPARRALAPTPPKNGPSDG